MGTDATFRCCGNSHKQHELQLRTYHRSPLTERGCGFRPREGGQIGETFQSLIFKRLTLQDTGDTKYDNEMESDVTAILEIAVDIKSIIMADHELMTMDWILKDMSNFSVKFQSLVENAMGNLPDHLKCMDDRMKGFRMLTVLVYAADLYLKMEDPAVKSDIETIVYDAAERLDVDWIVFKQLVTSNSLLLRRKIPKFWIVCCGLLTMLISFKCVNALFR